MDIVHLRPNEAANGCEKFSLFEDNFLYEKKMGNELSAIATTHYCPSCSKTKEFDRKLGRYKRKFRILKEDYVFDLSYKTDELGELYGYCKSCGFDMRNNNTDSVNHHDDDITIIREYEVSDYAEQNNSYIIEFKSFMEFFNNKKKGTITDMVISKSIGEETLKYRLDIDNLEIKSLKVNSNKYIEIPKKYWKS
tara:strand:- start:17954 stop:18535 length:582 start_codon:yes stop_codon:yes gene_type:complete